MLLKLVLPYHDRTFQGGFIEQWFKKEGDRINYGDDLLDLRLEEVLVTKQVSASHPKQWLEQMAQHVKGRPTAATEGGEPTVRETDGATEVHRWKAVVVLRINSSDMGYLRRICAREGEYCEVTGLVGLVTTEESESLADAAAATGVFRVVANMTQEY